MIQQKYTTGVDLGGLLNVLGKHLYSTPTVAVRELIQNAHDSITRRRIEDPGWQGTGHLQLDSAAGNTILRITDNGSGLTEREIHTYLATVGVGYTRNLREQSDALIGMFGLGFLSAFVIAENVTLTTTSYQDPGATWRYQSSNGETYTVAPATPAGTPGTCIELTLRNEFLHLGSAFALTPLIGHYCAFLAEPVYFGEARINDIAPPWRAQAGNVIEHPVQQRKRNLAFAKKFEHQFEPLCTLPVKPPGGDAGSLRGMLWIQDGGSYGSSDNRNLSVFVRGMLLDDDARDLLPRWAGFVGGVIESNHLTPTASREDLQRDSHYHQAKADLQDALIEGLADIAATQKESWRRIVARHNEALLAAALCSDRLFVLLVDAVRIPTSQGEMTLSALQAHGPVHVSMGASGGFEDMLFRALQIPVAKGDHYAVHAFLRRWSELRGGKLIEIGTDRGNAKLFAQADLPQAQHDWLAQHLANGESLVAAHFAPADLPLVVVPDREAELKERLESDESDERIAQSALQLVRMFTATIKGDVKARLYVNLDNPAIAGLLRAYAERGDSASGRQALALLRSIKIIMLSSDASRLAGGDSLGEALRGIGAAVQALAAVR
jgi:molecular chaperone HtpG